MATRKYTTKGLVMSSKLEIFLDNLAHSRKKEIVDLYSKISASFPELESEIKWNAPSFTLNGTNIVTFRLFPEPVFQLILHAGAKKLVDAPELQFEINEFKHRWADPTRCVIIMEKDFNWQELNKVIKVWIRRVAL